LKRRNSLLFPGEDEWREHVARIGVRPARERRPGSNLNVVQYIGQLNSGGAEHQLCNLALALRKREHKVRVLTTYPLTDENAHYLHLLRAGDVAAECPGRVEHATAVEQLTKLHIDSEVLGALPPVIRDPVLDLAGELLADPPDILHCWLDYPNVIGAAAGALVGTSRILLSTRNVNPTNFQTFYQPWMDCWYRFLVTLPNVQLLANSRAGAADYARWVGISDSRFHVIPNGVDIERMELPSATQRNGIRQQLRLGTGQPILVGVFRLAPEKQPLLFLDVVARARRQVPELKAAIVGVGELADRVRREIDRLELGDVVTLLGQRKDVFSILSAADVMLLTSAAEGTPNVVLESQLAGCPPVATAVGGTPEVIEDGVTGFLHEQRDAAGLAASIVKLLRDPEHRRTVARAGRERVRSQFSIDSIYRHTVAHYEALLRGLPPATPAEEDEAL
jgi:glycosyltransferase involved in cell wall biosynthesis